MKNELEPLPYPRDALTPFISSETLDFHYGKHHAGYLSKLVAAVEGTRWAESSLEDIVREVDDVGIFRNAAQTWNHTFYWNSMAAPSARSGLPGPLLLKHLDADLGGLAGFRESFKSAAVGQFGSGWAWLVVNDSGTLQITSTSDADNPMRDNRVPLLTLDVWEHAYYLDYKNERPKYVDAFLDNLVNWDFVEANLEAWTKSH